tara:strand:- start:11624 stop:12019 length:396 start_codon:yes stop_codon:yes gene_type:complete
MEPVSIAIFVGSMIFVVITAIAIAFIQNVCENESHELSLPISVIWGLLGLIIYGLVLGELHWAGETVTHLVPDEIARTETRMYVEYEGESYETNDIYLYSLSNSNIVIEQVLCYNAYGKVTDSSQTIKEVQ